MALPSQETLENLQKMFQGLNLDTITTVLLNNSKISLKLHPKNSYYRWNG